MSKRISKALAALLPGGALGASFLLALTTPGAAEARASQAADPTPPANVSERLLAIRAAVSSMDGSLQSSGSAEFEPGNSGRAEPTWWGNGGWRLGWRNGGFGWPNWHNWHNWGNGGWGNGGWNNGGWHNYWHNW
jgi:rSAM-associated Gly-rich repeat protein